MFPCYRAVFASQLRPGNNRRPVSPYKAQQCSHLIVVLPLFVFVNFELPYPAAVVV